MVDRRRWSVREFEEFLVRHPRMWHIARRLVWLAGIDGETGAGTGTGAVAFRLAEDRTFADVADKGAPAVRLSPKRQVRPARRTPPARPPYSSAGSNL